MGAYLGRIFEFSVPCAIFWEIFVLSVYMDRSRFRNCIYLLLAAASTAPLFCVLFGRHAGKAAGVLSVFTLIVLLAVPAVLIVNGVIMYRREGRGLANMLSMLLGIVIGAGELCAFLLFVFPLFWTAETADLIGTGTKVLLFISLSVVYGSMIFAAFMVYTVLLQIIPRKRDFDYVIIHGCGLIRGREVSKLLSDRLDKAIEVYKKDPTHPIMIPSGGQGDDEEIPEAEAMEKYLIEHGIPGEQIRKEDRSKTTRENLIFSGKVIEQCGGPGYTAIVTSNYHVYRALSLCRELEMKCTGIGAHVAPYYWPSAVIREFVAIISRKKNFVTFVAGWLLFIFPIMSSVADKFIQ